jgi:hypothetical protein
MKRAEEYTPHCFCKCAEAEENKRDAAILKKAVCAKCAQTIERKGCYKAAKESSLAGEDCFGADA